MKVLGNNNGKVYLTPSDKAIKAVVANGTDVSDTTAVASDVADGKYFYTADGTLTEGTAIIGGSSDESNNLPAAYQEVEWISSTESGEQYLLTDYYPKASSVFAIKTTINTVGTTDKRCFGERSSGTWKTYNGQCAFAFNLSGGSSSDNAKMRLPTTTELGTDSEYSKSWSSGIVPTDNTTYEFTNMTCCSTMITATYPMAIFCMNNMGTMSNYANCKIWYLSVTENGTKVAEWIPCYRKSDNVIGMYDLSGSICPLTNTPFYINAGSGTFIAGGNV